MTRHFYIVRFAEADKQSFCSINAYLDCEAVTASPFAELFSLPLSTWAAAWFTLILILTLGSWKKALRPLTQPLLLGASAVALLFSLIYLGIMAFKLQTFCPLCLGIDGISLGLLILTLRLSPKPLPYSTCFPDLAQVALVGILGMVATGFALEHTFQKSEVTEILEDSLLEKALHSSSLPLFSPPTAPRLGNPKAPVTITLFTDYSCPSCKKAAQSLPLLASRYRDQVQWVIRNFPIDQSCNPLPQETAHPTACRAAKTALCAQEQGVFSRALPFLYTGDVEMSIATKLGLNLPDFRLCLVSIRIQQQLDRDIQDAQSLGITGVPFFHIQGPSRSMLAQGYHSMRLWDRILKMLLLRDSSH